MKEVTWGHVCSLEYGKALRDYANTESDANCCRVYGTNGPIGWSSHALASGPGVIVGRKGAYRGIHFSEEPFFVIDTAYYLRAKDAKLNLKWAYYKLTTVDLDQVDVGAAIPTTNRDAFYALPVRIPEPKIQTRIASILSAYDDAIENNRRRMGLLEKAARLLYEEWFVRLRFPGYEHTPITNGLPKGWEKKPLNAICPDLRDTANPAELEPGTPYIGLEHMPRRSITLLDWGTSADVTSTKLRYQAGDILFGKIRSYFHKVGFALTDGVTSSDAIVLRPIDPLFYSFSLLTVSSDWFVAIVSKTAKEGSKMPRADWKLMEQHSIPVPSPAILESLNETIRPILDQLRILALQNQKLRAARDLLLPRLMSGEIEV